MGVEKNSEIFKQVANLVISKTLRIGKKDNRPFKPHVTIARIKRLRNKKAILDYTREKNDLEIGTFKVDRIYLMKSTLTSSGAIYEKLHEVVK